VGERGRVDDERGRGEVGHLVTRGSMARHADSAEERPPTERDWHTDELPPNSAARLPDSRDALGRGNRMSCGPLGADFGVDLVAFKRRIHRYLLWRAGPAVHADAEYMAIDADEPGAAASPTGSSPTARVREPVRRARAYALSHLERGLA